MVLGTSSGLKRIPCISVHRQQNLELGKTYDIGEDYMVFRDTTKVIDADTGKTIALLLKNVITDPKIIEAGRRLTTFKGHSERRADASGERRTFEPKSGNKKTVYLGTSVPSVMLGYEASDNYHPCRMTALTRKHRDLFDTDTTRLVQCVSGLFGEHCPEEYARQKAFVDLCNEHMVIPESVYTSLTVNMTWRTSLHVDKGDFRSGLGNLCVFKYGEYSGGEIMMPNYKIAFDLLEGDVLFMDVHEPHCNNALEGEGRVSLICYAREQIRLRCGDATREDIENPVSHRNREKRAKGPCVNCKTIESSEWRYAKNGECLCNPCGLYYKKNGRFKEVTTPSKPQKRRKQEAET